MLNRTSSKNKEFSNSDRYYWVDLAKAVSIFGVVYIHSGGLGSAYFRFGVPIFIAISFFLSERSTLTKKDFSAVYYWKKRIPRLLAPYLIWSFVYILFKLQPSYPSLMKFISFHWIGFGWSGQYYLLTLIALVILYPWLRKINFTLKGLTVFFALTFFLLYLPLNYLSISTIVSRLGELPFFYWLPYMFLGIFTARNYESIRIRLRSLQNYLKLSALILIPLVMNIENMFLLGTDVARQSYFRLSTIIVSPLILILFIGLEDLLQKQNLARSLIKPVSLWALGIFCLNPLLIQVLTGLLGNILHASVAFPVALVVSILKAVLVVLMAVFISYVIGRAGARSLVS